jgi:dolichol-phosphate mannosyltransferase
MNGIVGFSRYPLHLITMMGLFLSAFSVLIGVLYIVLQIIDTPFPTGNPTIVFLICLFSGIQLLSLGVMAEYVGRIYDEVKRRPRFILESSHGVEALTPPERERVTVEVAADE